MSLAKCIQSATRLGASLHRLLGISLCVCACLAARFSDIFRHEHLAQDDREDKVIEKRWDRVDKIYKASKEKKERERDNFTSIRSFTKYMGGFISGARENFILLQLLLSDFISFQIIAVIDFLPPENSSSKCQNKPIKMQICVYDFTRRHCLRSWKTLPAAT